MEDFTWIQDEIEQFEQDIELKKKELDRYKYDSVTQYEIKMSIKVLTDLVASLKKQLPVKKVKKDGLIKCPGCGCEVNRYVKYCHYCGQRMLCEIQEQEGVEGWCPDK